MMGGKENLSGYICLHLCVYIYIYVCIIETGSGYMWIYASDYISVYMVVSNIRACMQMCM